MWTRRPRRAAATGGSRAGPGPVRAPVHRECDCDGSRPSAAAGPGCADSRDGPAPAQCGPARYRRYPPASPGSGSAGESDRLGPGRREPPPGARVTVGHGCDGDRTIVTETRDPRYIQLKCQ